MNGVTCSVSTAWLAWLLRVWMAMTPATPMDFEEIRASIVNSVAESRQDKELNDYLADLREAAIIEWKDDTLRQIYEAFVAARAAASGV